MTPEAVRALAAQLVTASKPSVTIVGAGRKGAAYARMAERLTQEATAFEGCVTLPARMGDRWHS